MKRFTVLLICFLAASGLLNAQQTTISGQVKDSYGEPVPGAAIILTGTSEAAIADIDGNFSLTLRTKPQQGATITVSCLGYADQVLPIGSKTVFEIVLQDDSQLLEETVVIGYSTV